MTPAEKERVREVFEDFAEKYIATLNEYARRKGEECWDIEDDEEAYECVTALDAEETDATLRLREELGKRLGELGLELHEEVETESSNFFNAPGWPRAYNYYAVRERYCVVNRTARTYYYVDLHYNVYERPTETEYVLEEVYISDPKPLIAEDTPFAFALREKLLECPLRPLWHDQIESLVNEITEAERKGLLLERLKEVKERAERAACVYEYKHFLTALYETAEEFNIQL
jgi:hypothetical protein